MSSSVPKDFAAEVKGHYEELPYPFRDPEQEGVLFNAGDGCCPVAYSHYGWAGSKDFRTKGARILIAGDGTGDASVNWAETLNGTDGEIVAIDLSATSIGLAKQRLAKRQLTNVTHHHMSILDLPTAGLGEFDFIECSGVLHHLTDPHAGLAALGSVLKDDGLMAIMVYAQYGRVSVYMVQDLFRRIMQPGMSRADKLAMARAFLNNVPNTHWLTVKNETFLADIEWPDGCGIYDLLLHTTDRAYTVPQLYEWVEGAGLHLNNIYTEFTDDSAFLPEHYTDSPLILEPLKDKPLRERYAIGELMHGSISKHYFYATKQPKQEAEFADDMVIVYGLMQSIFADQMPVIAQLLDQAALGERKAFNARPFPTATPLLLTKRPATSLLLRTINGRRTVGDIVSEVARATKLSRNDVRKDLQLLYNEMHRQLIVFLQHESLPPYVTGPQIVERFRNLKR